MKKEIPKHNKLSFSEVSKDEITVDLIAGHILAEEYIAAKECLSAFKRKDTADADYWRGYQRALEHVLHTMKVEITRYSGI